MGTNPTGPIPSILKPCWAPLLYNQVLEKEDYFIFHLINESSELNKLDEELPNSITRNHPKNQWVHVPLKLRGHFQINHSCSPVTYNTSSFTAKNKD